MQAATKAEAKQKIAKEWDNIVAQQPTHKVDRNGAQSTAEAFVDALSEHDDNQQISVSAYGSVSWSGADVILAVSGTVSASLVKKI